MFLIWSIEHDAWWAPNEMGYTHEITEAGLYTDQRSAEIVTRANIRKFHEARIPLPHVINPFGSRGRYTIEGEGNDTKSYIGDGAFVYIDGADLVITTEDGIRTTNIVVLEPAVLRALEGYISDARNKQQKGTTDEHHQEGT